MMPIKTDDTVVETPLESLGAPVHARLNPVALAIEVAGDAFSPGLQVVGQTHVAEGFGAVGATVEMSLNPVGLMVKAGIDTIATLSKVMVVLRRCGRGDDNGDDQGGKSQ